MRKTVLCAVLALGVGFASSGCGGKPGQKEAGKASSGKAAQEAEGPAAETAARMTEAAKAAEQAAAAPKVEPVDFRELKALLPEGLSGMKRKEATGERSGAFGMSVSMARAVYEDEKGAGIEVNLSDMGGMGGMGAFAQFGWAAMDIDRETETGYEKTVKIDGFKGYEEYDKEARRGKLQVLVANRFMVSLDGRDVSMDALRAALKTLSIGKLQGLGK